VGPFWTGGTSKPCWDTTEMGSSSTILSHGSRAKRLGSRPSNSIIANKSTPELRDRTRDSSSSRSILDETFGQDEGNEIDRYPRTPCRDKLSGVFKLCVVNSMIFPAFSSIALKILPSKASLWKENSPFQLIWVHSKGIDHRIEFRE